MKKRLITALILVALFTTALFFASPSVAEDTGTAGGYGYGYLKIGR